MGLNQSDPSESTRRRLAGERSTIVRKRPAQKQMLCRYVTKKPAVGGLLLSSKVGAGDRSLPPNNHPPLWTPARVEILGIRPYVERLIA